MAARSNPYSTINQVRDVFPKLGELTTSCCSATLGAQAALEARPQPDHGGRAGPRFIATDQLRGTSGARGERRQREEIAR